MKPAYTFALFLMALCLSFSAVAQTPPQGITYQAVARGPGGHLLPDSALTIRIGVLAGGPSGTLQWEEEHDITTNLFGLFTLVIGQGISTETGAALIFDDIAWGGNTHYLSVEIDPGDGVFELMGVTQFLSVPYALYAGSAGSIDNVANLDTSNTNECISLIQLQDTLLNVVACDIAHVVDLSPLIDDHDWEEEEDVLYNTTHQIGIGTPTPNSSLQVVGSLSLAITTVTSPSTVVLDENTYAYLFDLTNGDINATLPAAETCYGRQYVIKLIGSGSNDLILQTVGSQTIDGSDDPTVPATSNSNFTLMSDGANWWVVQGNMNL